jgi:hypothetical protein
MSQKEVPFQWARYMRESFVAPLMKQKIQPGYNSRHQYQYRILSIGHCEIVEGSGQFRQDWVLRTSGYMQVAQLRGGL